jgi:Astacin (Peptidase family M12A)
MNWKTFGAGLIASVLLGACGQNAQPSSRVASELVPFAYALPDGTTLRGKAEKRGDTLLFDRDMVLPASAALSANGARTQGNIGGSAWRRGIVVYDFDPNLDSTTRTNVLNAMSPWRQQGIRFKRRTFESNYVWITTAYFPQYQWVCAASLGYQYSGGNVLYAGSACRTRDYVHEWGHILGLGHEHSRPDRDSYIIADYSLGGTDGYASGAYDFDSIMHYDAFERFEDGSVNYSRVLIQPLDGRSLFSFGWNETPSYGDRRAIADLYPYEPPCNPICP